MIKNICLLILGMLLSLFMFSCTDEVMDRDGSTIGNGLVKLNITIPNAEVVQSRTGDVLTDTSLEQLDLLLFDNTKEGSADDSQIKLIARRKLGAVIVGTDKPTARLPLSREKRLIYLVANAEEFLADISEQDEELLETDGVTYKYSLADIRKKLVTKVPNLVEDPLTADFLTTDIPQLPILMSGTWKADQLNLNMEIPIKLTRVFAKISVWTALPSTDLEILKVSVCNVARQADILKPETDAASDGKNYKAMTYKSETSEVYTYPTYVNEDTKPVSVIVEAKYKGGTPTFYRFLIHKDDSPLSLQRNYHYRVKINKVTLAGSDSWEDALNGPDMNMDYDVDLSEDFMNGSLLGGYYFSIDYDRIVVYADSLDNLNLATLKTNYPFKDGFTTGSIKVDDGLVLNGGRTTFSSVDSVRTFSVRLTSAYVNRLGTTVKKGIHISLGLFKHTVEVFKEPSLDIHPDVTLMDGISTARVLSTAGSVESNWITFSTSPVYSIYKVRTYLDEVSLSLSSHKGYVHVDENINENYREAELEVSTTDGVITKYLIHQEGCRDYLLGYFGGQLQTSSYSAIYAKNLIIEAYEEENNLRWLPEGTTSLTESDALALDTEDGIRATYLLATQHKSPAALYCLNKNRDIDGNGKIDESEIRWYMPSRGQLQGLLFYQTKFNNLGKAYWSSTYWYRPRIGAYGVWTLLTYLNNEEYANAYNTGLQFTIVPLVEPANPKGSVTGPRYVRCVRDK